MTEYNLEHGEHLSLVTKEKDAGIRIDTYLASILSKQSRSYIKKLITDKLLEVDGCSVKASKKLKGNEKINLFIPELVEIEARPENIEVDVIYEDSSLIVVNKRPGMVVHPSPGHESGALVNALLYHCKDLSGIGGALRPGIVHRLDKDTSGAIVVAKNDATHQHLAKQFAERTNKKVYYAISHGIPNPKQGEINKPIGRNPRHRQLMAVVEGGRESLTIYQTEEIFKNLSLIKCTLKSGRTHQIRVHLSSIGCPIICDTFYGREASFTASELRQQGTSQQQGKNGEVIINRQALHAHTLGITHPATGKWMEFVAPLQNDMANALNILKA